VDRRDGAARARGGRRKRCAGKPYAGLSLDERWDLYLKNALEAGISLADFWHATARELSLRASANLRRRTRDSLFMAWHVAALMRVEKLPSLDELLADPKTPAELEAERLENAAAFAELTAAHARAKAAKQ
jgi:hypothetical protein